MKTTASRYHDFSYGHRVSGHESKCRHLHGHNGRVHFTVQAEQLDGVGRVMDFSVIKEKLCMWVEDNWDHKFLAWEHDSLIGSMFLAGVSSANRILSQGPDADAQDAQMCRESIVFVPFNPTAELMAEYLLKMVGPMQLAGTGVTLIEVTIEETRKCQATVHLEK